MLYRAWLPALVDPGLRQAALGQASALLGTLAAPAAALGAAVVAPGQDPDDPEAASAALWAAAAQAQHVDQCVETGPGRRSGRGAGRPAGRRG